MANPSLEHWITIKCIFRYLQFKLWLRGIPPQEMVKYCDAHWANDLKDRRSTTWFVFMIEGGAIPWNNKRQPIIILLTIDDAPLSSSMDSIASPKMKTMEGEGVGASFLVRSILGVALVENGPFSTGVCDYVLVASDKYD